MILCAEITYKQHASVSRKERNENVMKILYLEWSSTGKEDLEEAFMKEGHILIRPPFYFMEKTYADLPEVESQLRTVLREKTPDVVFTVNYYPAISEFCRKEKIRYVAWIYDSPYGRLYSRTVLNPCNTIYVFDKELYLEFHNAGISTVHYMPMAANTERLDLLAKADTSPLSYDYDISFVGSLYLEKANYFDQMTLLLPDYAKGYLNALIAAQMKVQGYNFIEEVLGPVMEEMKKAFPLKREPGSTVSDEWLYANAVINRRITAIERIDLLDAVAGNHMVDFFTYYEDFTLPNVCNHGPVDYCDEMPHIFRRSRINLNITLRGMKSGIPLRAFDIMGCGGFLLSNFQADFLDFFVPGEDFVYYESKEDLLQKIDYYLDHEEERQAIAKNGHDKVAEGHTYRHRIREMFDF